MHTAQIQSDSSPIAQVTQLTRQYQQTLALDQLNLQVNSGEIVAILGPNGAGKSTLINCLLGLTQPSSGFAQIFGKAAGSLSAKQRIGVMLQQAELADTLYVDEILQQFSNYYKNPLNLNELVQLAGLQSIIRRKYGKLSGGQKRRVQFAIALAGNPALLFLDEPTTGLDVEARQQLWRSIRSFRQHNKSVVLTTHYLEEADQLADRIVILHQGRILIDGTPATIKNRINLKQLSCHTTLASEHPLIKQFQQQEKYFEYRTTQSGSQIVMRTCEPEKKLLQLLQADPQLDRLEVVNSSLEQAFLNLTALSNNKH